MAGLKKTWNKYTEGWLGSIIYLVLGFVIAYLFNMGLGFAFNTDTPVVAVFSDSMVPTFFRGDMILVYGHDEINVGDIIVFDVPDRRYPIIHRVHDMNEFITTKGDHNSNIDTWKTKKEDIHGKAILKIPLLGWVKILFVEITGLA